jgi:hypothetical protein
MRKIPTVFRRDPEQMSKVTDEVTEGCEWVLTGDGRATRKYDGTCVMFDGTSWWARREVKPGKAWPEKFWPVDTDEVTGKVVGWMPAEESGFHAFLIEAIEHLDIRSRGMEGTYELCGPKINGNPEQLDGHRLIKHSQAERTATLVNAGVYNLKEQVRVLSERFEWEGVVWHHPDGRMAKLKGRDL